MKKILLSLSLFLFVGAVASAQINPNPEYEIDSESIDSVYWDTTQLAWFEARTITFTNGGFLNYALPSADDINVAKDSAATWNYYFNQVNDVFKKEKRGITLVLENNGDKIRNELDSILIKIDSIDYETSTLARWGNKYKGIWKNTKDNNRLFEFKESANNDDRLRIIEVEEDGQGGYQNVSGGLTGNLRLNDNHFLEINGIYLENYDCVKLDQGSNGKLIFVDVNKVIRFVKEQ